MFDRFGSPALRGAWLRWLPTLFAFPIGGTLARVVVGPADDVPAAVAGGMICGVVLGVAQALALRPRVGPAAWIGASAVGLAIGLGLGAGAVDYGTGPADLALEGMICGAALGVAQWLVLRRRSPAAWRWLPVTVVAWALGWTVTRAVGIDLAQHWHVFGSSGALVATLITGIPAVQMIRQATMRHGGVIEGAAA